MGRDACGPMEREHSFRTALAAGLILVAVGLLRMLGGVQVVTYPTGQPMFHGNSSQQGSSASVPLSYLFRGSARQRECPLEGESRIDTLDELNRDQQLAIDL
jgi:hypothetical protein